MAGEVDDFGLGIENDASEVAGIELQGKEVLFLLFTR